MLADAVEHFARHGIGDASLRAIAAGVGTSHRMLIYHFGSREGLLAEVVRAVEQQQRELLAELSTSELPIAEQSAQFWRRVTEATLIYGPLFFEVTAYAMRTGKAPDLVQVWLPPLVELCVKAGIDPAEAPAYARLGLAAARGLLHDLLLTGDREQVDEASRLLDRLFRLPR
nr:TetR/AcrR family transcriptional regulator [Kribbella sandramycini]